MLLRSLSVLGVLSLLVLAACTVDTSRPVNPEPLISDGETLYWEQCSECHQVDGEGWSHIYPSLAGNPIVTLHDPAPLVVTVLNGQGSMPGFRGQLTSEEIAAILSYIRNAWGNSAPAVVPRQAQ